MRCGLKSTVSRDPDLIDGDNDHPKQGQGIDTRPIRCYSRCGGPSTMTRPSLPQNVLMHNSWPPSSLDRTSSFKMVLNMLPTSRCGNSACLVLESNSSGLEEMIASLTQKRLLGPLLSPGGARNIDLYDAMKSLAWDLLFGIFLDLNRINDKKPIYGTWNRSRKTCFVGNSPCCPCRSGRRCGHLQGRRASMLLVVSGNFWPSACRR